MVHTAVLAAYRIDVADELVIVGGDDDRRVLSGGRPANAYQNILDTGGALAWLEHHRRRFVVQAPLKAQKRLRVRFKNLTQNMRVIVTKKAAIGSV